MILTYRYRLLPSKRQHRALERILEQQRQLYNAALEERIDAYRKTGMSRTYIDQCKALTTWRQSDPEAAALPIRLQRWTLKSLDGAYQGFFRRIRQGGVPGFPRYRGKGRFDTFGVREFRGIRLEDGGLRFKGMPGNLRVHFHRPVPEGASIRSCVFRAATARARANHLHQASARLVREYDIIVVEKLNVKGLARSVLAKEVHDASWAKFISMLRYKAACAGSRVIEVDPIDTSQECSGCGTKVPKKLGDRLHACGNCGLAIDRDLNAARNILGRVGVGPGLRNVAGCGLRAGRNLDEIA